MNSVKTVSILGVTGSIGQSTADVIASAADRFDVDVVTAHRDVDGLAAAAQRLGANVAVIGDAAHEDALREALKGSGIQVLGGRAALEASVRAGTDLTISAITGIAGLKPLIGAIKNSKAVAIANKEPLVAAGAIVMAEAKKYATTVLPIDSEHNAVFQVFDPAQKDSITRIILTASGGPFLNTPREELSGVTPEQAVAHPNWDMGAKISVDSATMMNKALEVIEAHVLFDMPPAQIDVMIHPQSVVHSMVEYEDGSILSQMGASDMRTPICYALSYPDRMKTPGERLDLAMMSRLDFALADFAQFPALKMAYDCLERGPLSCLTFNAANEVAVAAFLNGKIGFLDILDAIEFALSSDPDITIEDLESVGAADNTVRAITQDYLNSKERKKA